MTDIRTCCKLYSQTRTKRLEKTKNDFLKCVLEFIFATIKGSGLFTYSETVKIAVPYQIYELLFLEPVTFGNNTTTRLERDKAVNLLQVELLIQLLLLLLFNCLETLCFYFRMVGADCSYDGWDLLGISYLETRIPALEQEFMLCNWLFLSSDRPIPAHDKLFMSCYKLQEILVCDSRFLSCFNICVLWQAIPAWLPMTGHSSPVIGYSCPATCYSGPATCYSFPVSGTPVPRGVIPTLEQ
jgi:hypothetical protein